MFFYTNSPDNFALHRTIWRHHFGGEFGPVVRQNTE